MKKCFVIFFTILLSTFSTTALGLDNSYTVNDLKTLFSENNAVIYAINIRTFNAKDLNNNDLIEPEKGETSGNFINAVDRLDDFVNFGINTIHILPITPVGKVKAMGTAGSLYSMSSLTSLNPQLKDSTSPLSIEAQAKFFIDECHRRGIRVIIDLPSCGSYDLYMQSPDLFVLDKKSQPIVPSDWIDVRLFKTLNSDGTLNEDLFELHKNFIDMVQDLGADGIRADVATIKPYEFWVKLIKYANDKDPQFLFLAEASDSWNTPPSDAAVFTNYKKLLDAGFDGYYGSYFNLKNWKSVNDLKKQVVFNQNLSKKYNYKKSVIGSFATHDELSPILVGKENFSSMIMWLNATLPLNPYYIDGFPTGDTYLYSYANKKAVKTFTDDDYYYVHKGKMDIFNFSRRPDGNSKELLGDFFLSLKLRQFAQDVIVKGNFKVLPTTNSNIFSYSRSYQGKSVIVIINRNLEEKESVKIRIGNLCNDTHTIPIKAISSPKIQKGLITIDLNPGETVVLFSSK